MSNRTLTAVVGGLLVIGLSGAAAYVGARLAQPADQRTDADIALEHIDQRLDEIGNDVFILKSEQRQLMLTVERIDAFTFDLGERIGALERGAVTAAPITEPDGVVETSDPDEADEDSSQPLGPEEIAAQNLDVDTGHLRLMFGMYADGTEKGARNRSTQGRMEGRQLAGELGLDPEVSRDLIKLWEEHIQSLGAEIGPFVSAGPEATDGDQVKTRFQELETALDAKVEKLLSEDQLVIYRREIRARRARRDRVLDTWNEERLNR